jgi:hypothetical protein
MARVRVADGWIATMRHIARENRMFVIGVNPVLHVDTSPRPPVVEGDVATGGSRAGGSVTGAAAR